MCTIITTYVWLLPDHLLGSISLWPPDIVIEPDACGPRDMTRHIMRLQDRLRGLLHSSEVEESPGPERMGRNSHRLLQRLLLEHS